MERLQIMTWRNFPRATSVVFSEGSEGGDSLAQDMKSGFRMHNAIGAKP